jgi:uncharacterized membrane protein HdeD (DUF308 family)
MAETSLDTAVQHPVRATVRRHALLFLIQAVLLVVAGLVAFVYPLLTSLAVTFFLGWMLIVSGVIQAIALVAASKVPHFWMSLISAVLSIVTGILFVRNPGVAVTTLALLLVIYFMVEGIAKVVLALTIRPLANWGWLLVSGIIGVGLSIFLIMNPLLSFVALGFFIGIQLISEGIAIGAMAWTARRA